MITRFFDRQDESNVANGALIQSERQLFDLLNRYKSRTPFFGELESENGYKLLIGIGPIGCVQYSPVDGRPPYLMAMTPSAETSRDDLEFLTGNTLTPVSTRYALPFDIVKKVAADFLKTGDRSSAVSWEEI